MQRLHANARLTSTCRQLPARRAREFLLPVTEAARVAAVSRRTTHEWLPRYDAEGCMAAADSGRGPKRASRPGRRLDDRGRDRGRGAGVRSSGARSGGAVASGPGTTGRRGRARPG
ncbi:MAG: leucine zipper domain-containing protein [Myxococcota bacterium]